MSDTTTTPPRGLRSRLLRPSRPDQRPEQQEPQPPAAPVLATTISRRTLLPDGSVELYEWDSVRGERTTILSPQDAALERLPENPTPIADQVALERHARGLG